MVVFKLRFLSAGAVRIGFGFYHGLWALAILCSFFGMRRHRSRLNPLPHLTGDTGDPAVDARLLRAFQQSAGGVVRAACAGQLVEEFHDLW